VPMQQLCVTGHERGPRASRLVTTSSSARPATLCAPGFVMRRLATTRFGTLQGLEQIYPVTGGVILDLGDEGRTFWFATAGSGGGFTTPAGEFSTLSKNAGTGVYSRTTPDGTQMTFSSGGRVSTIARPDSTSESFTNDQEQGWTNTGTSGSPAPATLLAAAGGTYTSPKSNTSTIEPIRCSSGFTRGFC
jgi:hypothetical protein